MNIAARPFAALMLSALLLGGAAQQARAADSAPPAAAADPLAAAREQIAAKHWAAAIEELQKVNATGSADWNNLMGYSMRKRKVPDYAAAERYYAEALRIDPQHRGTLEYSGELALMKGDLPTAEQRLAALDKACTFSCSEYRDLKKAIERYKANGNRYAAAD
jgi:tetratricopeptide (TPR) repeat protein